MEIFSVTRSSFAKSGKCKHTHTLNFDSESSAQKYVESSMELDSMYAKRNPRYSSWEYILACKTVY